MKSLEERVEALEAKKYGVILNDEEVLLRDKLLSSLLSFTQHFFKIRTGKEYKDWPAVSGPSMLSQLVPAFEATVFETDPEKMKSILRQYFGVAPRTGKTELCLHFIAWGMAHFPDSLYMYITYSAELSRDNTKIIRDIMSLSEYRRLFGISIKHDSNKANHFILNTGGEVRGLGSDGPITGKGAGLSGLQRHGGAIVMDDLHKPYEAMYSRASREKVWNWYKSTASSRYNNPLFTPGILTAQRVHQEDIAGIFLGLDEEGNRNDEHTWVDVSLPMVDKIGNLLRPDMFTKESAREKARVMPYEWAAQYQQDPTDDANSLFSVEDFPVLNVMPNIEVAFVCVDSACCTGEKNDYTAISCLGLYKRQLFLRDSLFNDKNKKNKDDNWGLHLINTVQEKIEPDEIEDRILSFMMETMDQNDIPNPSIIVIELAGVAYAISKSLKKKPGITVIDIQRSGVDSTPKSRRFGYMQPYIKRGMITIQSGRRFNKVFLSHMTKITPNDSHSHDDIADTIQMACEKCFDQEVIQNYIVSNERKAPVLSSFVDTAKW